MKARLVTLSKILNYVILQASGTKVTSIKTHFYQTQYYRIHKMVAVLYILIQATNNLKIMQNSTFRTSKMAPSIAKYRVQRCFSSSQVQILSPKDFSINSRPTQQLCGLSYHCVLSDLILMQRAIFSRRV